VREPQFIFKTRLTRAKATVEHARIVAQYTNDPRWSRAY
jgi:hypothetical protein